MFTLVVDGTGKQMKNFKLTNGTRGWAIEQIQKMDLTEPMRLGISEWKGKRGLSANALSWVWYKIIGDFNGMTTDEVHADCKIRFGLSILFHSSTDYAYTIAMLLDNCKFYNMPLEKQWKTIEPIAVTSKFTTKEMKDYTDSIQRFYGMQGIILESNNSFDF